jgi:DNA repair exonuclease SbcCD ATPase subunit
VINVNAIYLPRLDYISITDFSLYNKEIYFKFVLGVNLIIGVNGVGKTTFINLIKYGLLGAYKKELDIRMYRNEKRENRKAFPNSYFRSRMKPDSENNRLAKIKIGFYINDTYFEVTRSLYDIMLLEVSIEENKNKYSLQGNLITQQEYDKLNDNELQGYLQFQYEKAAADKANLYDFNDLIFFINTVLTFGEDRKTILWDSTVQERLSSKYFNNPELDNSYEVSKRQSKYYDSLARHKSEDIRAITKMMKSIQEKSVKSDELISVVSLNQIKSDIEKLLNKIEIVQVERKEKQELIRVNNSNKGKLTKEIQELERKLKLEEENIYKELWEKLNPDYPIFLNNIKLNKICPLCNKELDIVFLKESSHYEEQCMFCKKPIRQTVADNVKISLLKKEIDSLLKSSQNVESEICSMENKLEKLDSEYGKIKNQLFEKQKKQREIEHLLTTKESNNDEELAFKAMQIEIENLEKEKRQNQEESQNYLKEADKILSNIDKNLIEITKDLSNIFSSYAGNFLGLPAQLTYDSFDGEEKKRYYPVIDSKERKDVDELSESQSFFIDHSFRMSLLNFFYQTPLFFMCETPDSSLDISYEENAAKIFLKFLEKPNSLIITSNLNNSKFLDYIIDHSSEINSINLLNYGRPSGIQSNNDNLKNISNRIEEKINGRKS